MGTRIFADEQVSAMAATNGEEKAIMLANYSDREQHILLDLEGADKETEFVLYVTDENRTYEKLARIWPSESGKMSLFLSPYSVMLLEQTK